MRLIRVSAGKKPSRSEPFFNNRARVGLRFLAVVLVVWLVAWAMAQWLITSVPLVQADAVAVMAGSAVYKERTQRAAELYLTGRAPKIILTNDNQQSGWSAEEQRNIPYHELANRTLRGLGVPGNAIETLPDPVSSTYDEALVLREYAKAKGLRSLLVVTSAYHSRRTLWTMRQTFDNSSITIGLEPVPPGQQTPSPVTWWLHSRGWQLVPGEYLKMIYYLLLFE
jgi:uncharacterized SAM-binding protein YcdF (DUF218 family)